MVARCLFALIVLLAGCQKTPSSTDVGPTADAVATPAKADVERTRNLSQTSAAKLIRELEADIAFNERKAKQNNDWMAWQRVADNHRTMARLTGDWSRYSKASQALKRAFAAAPKGGGPWLSQAGLDYSLHRFPETERSLAAAERAQIVLPDAQLSIMGMRGDLAFAAGRFDEATQLYEEAIKQSKSAATFSRLAILKSKTGDIEEADRILDDALVAAKTEGPMTQAWVHLQRGLLDLERGNYDRALERYQAGQNVFDGWYLIDEHIAEIRTLKGQNDVAIHVYKDIVARTNRGEFMDALADVYEAEGKQEESANMRKAATEAFENDIKDYPSAAYGHALEHFLAVNPERALVLARKNQELRPGPEANEALLSALVANGLYDEAKSVVEALDATPWSTTGFHSLAMCIAQKVGNSDQEQKHRQATTAINPKFFEGFECPAAP